MNRSSRHTHPGFPMAIAVAVLMAPLTVPAPAASQTRTADPFSWSGALRPGATLEIKGINGTIRAVSGSGSTAVVEATRTARRNDPEEVRIVVVEYEAGVTICAVYPSTESRPNECAPGDGGRLSSRNNDTQVTFAVQVPESVDFIGRSTNGNVTVEGVETRVDVSSTNGDVLVDGGSEVQARTTNGSVRIRSNGYASARTTNGEIRADLPGFLSASGPWRFSTTNGGITLRLPSGVNAEIDASTTNGRIRSDFPLTVSGTIDRRHIRGTMGSGGPMIELETTNGEIAIEQGS